MRGIGQGQTVELVVVPEVKHLINETPSHLAEEARHPAAAESDAEPHAAMLQRCVAWLLYNSMASESTQ